jgi:hypothetical protein
MAMRPHSNVCQHRMTPIWGGVALLLALSAVSLVSGEEQDVSAQLLDARTLLQQDLQKELGPIFQKHEKRLASLKKALTQKGDLKAATAVEADLKRIELQKEQVLYSNQWAGNWDVSYSNGVKRNYTLLPGGRVRSIENGRETVGKAMRSGSNVLLDFGDGKLEVLSLSPVLQVKHFMNPAGWEKRQPDARGTGERLE